MSGDESNSGSRRNIGKKANKRRKKKSLNTYNGGDYAAMTTVSTLPTNGMKNSSSIIDFDITGGPVTRPGTFDSKRIREDARIISSKIMLKQMKERDILKYDRLNHVQRQREMEEAKRKISEKTWQRKMKTSPFLVDLVAESERVDEENRVRLREEMRRQMLFEKRKVMVKNEIILQALAESSDLDALRQEKRNIMLEERRLKALLDLEKAKSKRKNDLLSAQRAEKERKAAAGAYRRSQKLLLVQTAEREEKKLLIEKLDIKNSKNQYGISVGKGVIAPLGGDCGGGKLG